MFFANDFTTAIYKGNIQRLIPSQRQVSFVLSILVIGSMILSSLPLALITPPAYAAGVQQAPDEELYRVQVTLKHPYDTTRLAQLGLTVNPLSDDQAVVVANRNQLATLARRGFEPTNIVAMETLIQIADDSLSTARLTALDAPDSDSDGLTDQEEEWWCTDPTDSNSDSPLPPSETNPSDGAEVQAILSGVTAYGPPFSLWPQFTPYNPAGNCPDGDFDGVPDDAEELIIGTSPLRESSDKDKFDDGQELFGVTFCPASSGPCGYGILPRAEDAAFVSANLPAWVLPPGDSPWVAAFPEPEVEVVPSSIKMTARTTIQTEKTITEGEEHTYGTATTKGTSTSLANSVTWNEWEEVSQTTALGASDFVLDPIFNSQIEAQGDLAKALKITGAVVGTVGAAAGVACLFATAGLCAAPIVAGVAASGALFPVAASAVGAGLSLLGEVVDSGPAPNITNVQNNYVQNISGSNNCGFIGSGQMKCDKATLQTFNNQQSIDVTSVNISNQERNYNYGGTRYAVNSQGHLTSQPIYYGSWPTQFTPTTTSARGVERGGSQTTTHTEYEEQTISESSTNQFSESWSNATAIDTAHAADLRFTYNIVNNGTEYAREVTSLLFNIYIGDDPNPAYTYVAVGATGQIAKVENLFPGESLTFTSNPIALNLDEMQAIDEGAPIRIVMEDIAFGQDQAFYQDALNGSVLVAMEDGFDDGDEIIDTYLIPVWAPSDTVQDVLKRYFPATEDEDGDLLSISTPEFDINPPIFNQHALTGTSWWNMYLSDGLNYSGDFKTTLAAPNTSLLIRILSDRDLDGYNDRNETKLGTDPDDPASHPNPELLAGYTTDCSGNDCTVLMSFLNTGNYDAYGVEAIMYSPDGLTEITNNTIGGSGRVPAGRQVVLGTRVLPPDLTGWTGGAEPYSTGFYLGNIDRTYSFTATTAGNIGAGSLVFDWSDDQGGSGTVDFGSSYQAPLPVDIGQGVQIGFQSGGVNAGESFTVRALTPRDTFQYTINDPAYAEPVIVVSYNDPQGNHRFILPTGPYPSGAQLTDLNSDLQPLSGQMLLDPGVDISSTAEDQAHFILNAPHPSPITDGHLFVEYIDSEGNVDQEDVFTQTLETGPTIIPLTVDTNVFTPTDYILLAFMTDSQGNIIDSSARPLASFGPDPLPIANLTAGEWQVGTLAIMSVPDPWDFGTVEAGTLLSARLTLANSGLAPLRYTLVGLGSGVSVAGSSAGTLPPTESRVFNLTVDTAGMPAGPFTRSLALRTNDPNNPSIPINLAGTITGAAGAALAHQVNLYRPWDQYVSVPGPQNVNDLITFNHTITDDAARMHPLYLYTEDESTLKGVGEFGVDFVGETISFEIFGTGLDGDLTVGTGQTEYTDNTRSALASSASAGQNDITLTSASGFTVDKEVLIIQMQGTGVGNHEFRTISNVNGNILTLLEPLTNTYAVGGNSTVQVIQVPHFRDITIQSGGKLTAHAWNGSTGGIVAFRASGTVSVEGEIDVAGQGYTGGPGGSSGTNGKQGESYTGPGSTSTNPNNGGGGGGQGSFDADGADGGGGGGYGSNGSNGGNGGGGAANTHAAGQGGTTYGSSSLNDVVYLGSGGGGGGGYFENSLQLNGGNGGGIALMFIKDFVLNGTIKANGANAVNNPDPVGSRRNGVGGGGAGGSIYILTRGGMLGTNNIQALGGTGGIPGSEGGGGGNGGAGRIRIDYCDSISGSTNPGASTQKLDCYILRQLPGSPDNDTELFLPDAISASTTTRYVTQYGQRSSDTSGGDQLFSVRLPNRSYTTVALSALVELVTGSGTNFNFCLDLGNDSVCDWSPAQQSFSGPVRLDTDAAAETSLAAALNAYIQAQTGSAENLLVPIRVNLDTPADIFLFNLVATPGQDVDLHVGPLTVTPGPSDITEGTLVTLAATISNTGIYTAENFIVAFYDGDPANEGVLIGSTFVEALGPISSTVISQSWNTTGLDGSRTLYIKADLTNAVSESDETNNTQTVATTVIPKLTGPDILTIDAGGPDPADPAYDPVAGYGWLTEGSTNSTCGTEPEKTYREESSINNLEYRLDNLTPDRYYHLDLTFGLCSGERWVNIFVDDQRVGESIAGLGGDQVIASTHVTTTLKTVSILLDPATYENGSIKLSIRRAEGLGGPFVNLIDLREIRYCHLDSGPGEAAWTAENNCGYDSSVASDVFDGWGDAPEETVRFSETGQLKYKFTNLDPAKAYNVGLTFYEGDNLGRQQQIRFDGVGVTGQAIVPGQPFTLGPYVLRGIVSIPQSEYTDGEVTVIIERLGGSGTAIVSEVVLEESTRRYAGDPPPDLEPPTIPPGSDAPQVEISNFTAAWNGSQVDVAWSTTTEINNGGFTLFRSSDGILWTGIHTEPSSRPCGNYSGTPPVNYSFTDTSAVQGNTYYYRIQFNGTDCGIGNSMSLLTAQTGPSAAPDGSIYLPIISKQQ